MTECNADLGHPCDAGFDGAPCDSCLREVAYWRDQWERYGKHEMRNRQTIEEREAEAMDAYSDPAERGKRDHLLSMIRSGY